MLDRPDSNQHRKPSASQPDVLDNYVGSRPDVHPSLQGEALGAMYLGFFGGVPGKIVGETWKEERAAALASESASPALHAVEHLDSTGGAFKSIGKGAAIGIGAALADVGLNTALQGVFGENIAGKDLFRPTAAEEFGVSVIAAAPLDTRLKIALAATSWLGGRVLNFYHGEKP